MRFLSLCLILGVAALAGCSTSPTTQGGGNPPPDSRIFLNDTSVKRAPDSRSNAIVRFARDSGGYGSACVHDVYLNDKLLVQLQST